MKAVLVVGGLIVAAFFLGACGGDPEPTATPPPTYTPTPTSTPVPTATPQTVASATAASNIPFPTSTITPTPEHSPVPTPSPVPSPTPNPAVEVMNLTRNRMSDVTTLAFEIDIVLDIQTGGLKIEVPVKYAGDFHSVGYSFADLMIEIPFETIETNVITSSGTDYIFDATADRWDPFPGDTPFFAGPIIFLGSNASEVTDLTLVGRETLDGMETHVVSARRPGVEIGGATGDLDVVYWIGVEDNRLYKVEANGDVEFGEEGVPGIDISVGNAKATLNARLFDYEKSVDIISPELAMARFQHEVFLLDDGRILVMDGSMGFANNDFIVPIPISIIQTYDFKTGLWFLEDLISYTESARPFMNSVAMLKDGRIFTIGISPESETPTGAAAAFNPTGDSWTRFPSPPTPRGVPDVILLADQRVFVTGGWDFGASDSDSFTLPDSLGVTEIFDPERGRWEKAASMNEPAEGQAVVLLRDGRVLVAGGTTNDREGTARAEIYDPETDVWTLTENMGVERERPKAVLLSDGRVLVTGDSPGSGQSRARAGETYVVVASSTAHGRLGSAETYDPENSAWTAVGSMSHPRMRHTLTVLLDGRVLAAGGENPFGYDYMLYSTTEIFDPMTNTWSPGPDLGEPRSDHSATLLPDGRVLLVGGIGQEDERYPLISTEFVTP